MGSRKPRQIELESLIAAQLQPEGFYHVVPLHKSAQAVFAKWTGEARQAIEVHYTRGFITVSAAVSHESIARLSLRLARDSLGEPTASKAPRETLAYWLFKEPRGCVANVPFSWLFFDQVDIDIEEVARDITNTAIEGALPFFRATETPVGSLSILENNTVPRSEIVSSKEVLLPLVVGRLDQVEIVLAPGPRGFLSEAEISVLRGWLSKGLPDTSAEAETLGWGPPGTPRSKERIVGVKARRKV